MAGSSHHTLHRGDVLWRATLDGVLIRVPGADEVVQLTGTGASLWAALAAPRSFADLCTELAESFAAPVDRVASDLGPVIDDLVERAVVRRDD